MNRRTDIVLAVDVGNSAIKFGRFRPPPDSFPEPEDVFRTAARSPDFERLARWLPRQPACCFLASVYRQAGQEIAAWLSVHSPHIRVHELTTADFGIRISVKSPERVGHDRLANALACSRLKLPSHSTIVIDAGSAITVDAVSPEGHFIGGAILAGQQASAQALSAGTDRLPLLSTARLDVPPAVIGDSTENAILSGLYWGTVGAIREIVQRIQGQLGEPSEVILTGGDMHRLAPHVAPDGRVCPNLVLSGIVLAARQTSKGFDP